MQYRGVWTNKGLEKLAAFTSGGKTVSFAQVAIGDGGGAIPEPSAAVTALAREVWRGAINTVSQNAKNTSSVLVEIVIPYNVGGFFIREWGIYDDEGDLLVYGNHAEFYKALLAEGTGAELRELIELPITNEGAVQITVSYESLASVDFVKSQIQVVLQKLSNHENDPEAHEEAIAEAVKKAASLPLGHYFLHPHETIPEYAIAVNGGTYSRTLYRDLWDYAQKKGWVKTEAEWQQIAGQNNGCCPYWSDDDGSSTFRVPKFAPYQMIGLTAGEYFGAGLPNITGDNISAVGMAGTGAFSSVLNTNIASGSTYSNRKTSFDASRSSFIYGRSDTVQPESHSWVLCIVALNKATNIGEADVAEVMGAIAKVQGDHNALKGKLTDSYISGLGKPNGEYITIPYAQSIDYIAPANGYIAFYGTVTTAGYPVYIINTTTNVKCVFDRASSGNAGIGGMVPVRNGDNINIVFQSTYYNNQFVRFYYAEGEV